MTNPFERLSIKVQVVKTNDVLADPEKYRNENLMIFKTGSRSMAHARRYAAHNIGNMTTQRMILMPESDEWTEQAKNFMFEVRDRLAVAQEDSSKQHKESLYRSAKKDCGFVWPDGKLKSIYDLNKREVWELTRQLMIWAQEAGAYLDDMDVDYEELFEREDV
jgi:hypothetical protein